MHGDYLIYSNLMHLIHLNPTVGTVLHGYIKRYKILSNSKIQCLNKNTCCSLQQSIEKPRRKRGFLDQQRKL